MEAEGLTFGLNAIVSILFAGAGALGFWYTIKGSVNILEQRVKTLEANDKVLHKRVENLKEEVKENREKSDTSISEITEKMQAMELRIITAIHELGK
jgi:chaperonin cofactor prefoldin